MSVIKLYGNIIFISRQYYEICVVRCLVYALKLSLKYQYPKKFCSDQA